MGIVAPAVTTVPAVGDFTVSAGGGPGTTPTVAVQLAALFQLSYAVAVNVIAVAPTGTTNGAPNGALESTWSRPPTLDWRCTRRMPPLSVASAATEIGSPSNSVDPVVGFVTTQEGGTTSGTGCSS